MSSRPSDIKVGRGVKIYTAPDYGRQDASVVSVNNTTGVIDARTVKRPKTYRNIPYVSDAPEGAEVYWIELPEGYSPGSEGH